MMCNAGFRQGLCFSQFGIERRKWILFLSRIAEFWPRICIWNKKSTFHFYLSRLIHTPDCNNKRWCAIVKLIGRAARRYSAVICISYFAYSECHIFMQGTRLYRKRKRWCTEKEMKKRKARKAKNDRDPITRKAL